MKTLFYVSTFFISFICFFRLSHCNSTIVLTHRSSQFNQDILLYYHYFQNKRNGFFIELGAYDGVNISNTLFFEKSLNWYGILIEGGGKNCKALQRNSKIRSNSIVICSPICKGEYVFYNDNGVYGNLNHSHSINKNKKLRKCNTLKNITEFFKVKHIDLFSLDVEGSELEVLETFDFNVKVSHWMIEWPHLTKEKQSNITSLLNKNGYFLDNTYIPRIDVIFSKHIN